MTVFEEVCDGRRPPLQLLRCAKRDLSVEAAVSAADESNIAGDTSAKRTDSSRGERAATASRKRQLGRGLRYARRFSMGLTCNYCSGGLRPSLEYF